MRQFIIKNAKIINEGETFIGHVLIDDNIISQVSKAPIHLTNAEEIEAKGLILVPGVIDDQVHFREPGLTHKADIESESKAAAAGGTTSFMEMPNTNPQTTTLEQLQNKFEIAEKKSAVNYSFYFGATNDNHTILKKLDPKTVCGIKVFMGSSTGNMLVDDPKALATIFSEAPMLVAVHCEDEKTVQNNLSLFKEQYGDDIPLKFHPAIRNAEACYLSSSKAVELAKKYDTRLHILHISTERELQLFDKHIPLNEKRITAEVCIHHLYFDDSQYDKYGSFIKWNPAVKSASDRDALLQGLLENRIDVIATDHAPHTYAEKQNVYTKAPAGGPMVQHSLVAMLEYAYEKKISYEKVIEKMCHAPADMFKIDRRGYIREGYFADFVLVAPDEPWEVAKSNIRYKCGWSPMEGRSFHSKIIGTWVNGVQVYSDKETEIKTGYGKPLQFLR